MKRSFLRELGIDAEVIDKIMAENGKDIEKYKSEIEDYVSEIKELKSKNVDMDKAIADAVKEKEAEFESKLAEKDKVIKETEDKVKDFDKISEELNGIKQANADREYTEAINNFFTESKVDFTSNFAKEAILNKFKEKKFELKEGKFGKDASKFIDELKTTDAGAFKDIKDNTKNNQQYYQYEPKGTNSDQNSDLQAQVNSILGLD